MSATIQRDRQIPGLIADSDRDEPTPDVIEGIRARFPTETEYDRMLTRKMERRAGQGYRSFDLDLLTAALENMLRDVLPSSRFEVRNARWLTGGASKIQMGFTLRYDDSVAGEVTEDLVLRMEPPESLNATSRMREFEVINALAGTVPVPTVRWVDEDGRWFPEPALVYTWVHGSAKPSRAQSRIAGIGINFGPELREVLAPQFVDLLARIHTFDVMAAKLDHYEKPAVAGTESALWQLNRARRVWEEDRGEDFPLLDVAAGWLEDNLPVLDRVSLVHGDYRGGNFLFDENTGSVTAILDWERSFLGDRHRDLAWATLYPFGHPSEDGSELLATGLLPTAVFFEMYEQASGLTVDPEKLTFYRILNEYQSVVTALGSAYRVSKLGKTHRDVLLTGLEATGYLMAHQLGQDLEEVL
ncbi:phosphotransferase family protein [Rhodococcus koreensis]|uniref:Predicted kinase, aminoglycoside phosphotransferase (APT) family n=1 Tax=Rhodococcus koreensis TaxID=99653 RepID=A0A1H4XIB7_9NOCA|nr:phosphotransferase family protein [Rhodococcus koreensis]SED05432.1 Predicted kinase, aminoglycoside phosphotransferase (APT) family [Rhodococcus koreensis]